MPHEDDADRAVRAAIAMIDELRRTGTRSARPKGKLPVDIGIGLNTDSVVSGNIGSPKRMDYTIIGDGVNLAARLESACKQYGAQHPDQRVHLPGSCSGTYRTREIDLAGGQGQDQAGRPSTRCSTTTPTETFPNLSDAMGHFRDALAKYRSRALRPARRSSSKVLAINAADKAAQHVRRALQQLLKNPPAGRLGRCLGDGRQVAARGGMKPLVLFGWLVCVAAASRPSFPAAATGPVVPQADYLSARAAAAALPQLHGLLVSHRGRLGLRRHYARGYSAGRLANIKSASKSIIATLVGIAIERGLPPAFTSRSSAGSPSCAHADPRRGRSPSRIC